MIIHSEKQHNTLLLKVENLRNVCTINFRVVNLKSNWQKTKTMDILPYTVTPVIANTSYGQLIVDPLHQYYYPYQMKSMTPDKMSPNNQNIANGGLSPHLNGVFFGYSLTVVKLQHLNEEIIRSVLHSALFNENKIANPVSIQVVDEGLIIRATDSTQNHSSFSNINVFFDLIESVYFDSFIPELLSLICFDIKGDAYPRTMFTYMMNSYDTLALKATIEDHVRAHRQHCQLNNIRVKQRVNQFSTKHHSSKYCGISSLNGRVKFDVPSTGPTSQNIGHRKSLMKAYANNIEAIDSCAALRRNARRRSDIITTAFKDYTKDGTRFLREIRNDRKFDYDKKIESYKKTHPKNATYRYKSVNNSDSSTSSYVGHTSRRDRLYTVNNRSISFSPMLLRGNKHSNDKIAGSMQLQGSPSRNITRCMSTLSINNSRIENDKDTFQDRRSNYMTNQKNNQPRKMGIYNRYVPKIAVDNVMPDTCEHAAHTSNDNKTEHNQSKVDSYINSHGSDSVYRHALQDIKYIETPKPVLLKQKLANPEPGKRYFDVKTNQSVDMLKRILQEVKTVKRQISELKQEHTATPSAHHKSETEDEQVRCGGNSVNHIKPSRSHHNKSKNRQL
ncbi:hypothetical protein GJ496_010865 [Pomphorhynchus laevis]|nr:hypothetical protein GJ496_010865 [Pomphorhynchus laevis]